MGIQNLIPDLVKEVELLPAQRVLSTHHSASEAIKEVQRENKADGLQGALVSPQEEKLSLAQG